MSHAAISSAEEGSQRVPVRRMKGLVGYDDILPWLDQAVAYEKHSAGWQQCRSRLLAADADSLLQQSDETQDDRLREWRDDECPLRRGIDYAHFFWELDSWTEYWDIYHPETHGRFYFGDDDHAGLLTEFLPSPSNPRNPVFAAWKRLALYFDSDNASQLGQSFEELVRQSRVTDAVLAVDELVLQLVRHHFSDASGVVDELAYLDAMERFGKDTLPECPERYASMPDHDSRKSSSLHHTIEGDLMWFGWAMQLECAELVAPFDATKHNIRRMMMAGAALGCSFDFAFRGRRRTRREFSGRNYETSVRIWTRALCSLNDFEAAVREMRELFQIRELGDF